MSIQDPNPKDKVEVLKIIDSVKKRIYIEDDSFFEKRMKHIEKAIESCELYDMGNDFPIFKIWPFKIFGVIVSKVFRKFYYNQTQNHRDAMHLMLEELKTMKLILKDVGGSLYPNGTKKNDNE